MIQPWTGNYSKLGHLVSKSDTAEQASSEDISQINTIL